jgi:hypothetical protein
METFCITFYICKILVGGIGRAAKQLVGLCEQSHANGRKRKPCKARPEFAIGSKRRGHPNKKKKKVCEIYFLFINIFNFLLLFLKNAYYNRRY